MGHRGHRLDNTCGPATGGVRGAHPVTGSSAGLIGGDKQKASRKVQWDKGRRQESRKDRKGMGRWALLPHRGSARHRGRDRGPTPTPALSDGRRRQLHGRVVPQARSSANENARAGAGPSRAETAAARSPRSGATRKDTRRAAGGRRPEALRRRANRSPPLHRHTAFPYELVQRQVRHLVAAPTMRRSERVPEMTQHDFRSSPRPQKYGEPRPGSARCAGAPHKSPRPPSLSFAYGAARRGSVRPAAVVLRRERQQRPSAVLRTL